MKVRLARLLRNKSRLRVLSGWFANLSAGAVGLIIFTPNFIELNTFVGVGTLTFDFGVAIMTLHIVVKLDERINK